jgi:4-phospho-D-threonate 3-dehydrogenase / 4-phospho-D-erythronate 3-dehydrogenase
MKIGITMGDPCGVGPEILYEAVKAVQNDLRSSLVLFGDLGVYDPLGIQVEKDFKDCFESLEIRQLLESGCECYQGGEWALRYLCSSVAAAMSGEIQGIVTGPVNKKAISRLEPEFTDQTSFYGKYLGEDPEFDPLMAFHGDRFSLALLTSHLKLSDLSEHFLKIDLERRIELSIAGFEALLGQELRVAICGFNPHAGEGGLLSSGEDEKLSQAVARVRKNGKMIQGPLPADTLFCPRSLADLDLVIACYHDQGLAPFKQLHFDTGVGVTFGLPTPRMSVDHGTAFDLVGTGKASSKSLENAIRLMDDFLNS